MLSPVITPVNTPVTDRDEPEPAPGGYRELQPEYYKQFRCLAEACPDTCCEGWKVGIDKKTYDKYQQSSDVVLRPAFSQFVTIDPARTSDDQYATLVNSGGRCSFLSEGLCSIQARLGETYLGAACASFPRVTNLVNGTLERTLDLSCPEAARLALLNPAPLQFSLIDSGPTDEPNGVAQPKPGLIWNKAFFEASDSNSQGGGAEQATKIRSFVQSILQNRKYPVTKRLILLGHFCSKLTEIAGEGSYQTTQTAIEGFSCAIDGGLFDEHLSGCTANPATQLAILFEFIVERVKSDFTHRRFLELYQEFLDGLRLTPDLTIQQMGAQYAEAHRQYYVPLMSRHEYVLEHYLVNNAFKSLFPFGSQGFNRALQLETPRAITGQYILLTSYHAIVKAMLIGVAAHHRTAFDLEKVVKTVQICSKTFEHSVAYPKRILEILEIRGITSPAEMSVLTQDPASGAA